MTRGIAPIAAALLLSACSLLPGGRSPLDIPETIEWRSIATEHDRTRLRNWRTAFVEGLAKARAAGHGGAVAREGALLLPDAALPWQAPPPGDYDCRVLKVGAKSPGLLDFVTYPKFTCRLRSEGGLMSFAKLTGSQRPIGMLLPDTPRRMVFLGTLQLGDERRALEYGVDQERDMAGLAEKIGDRQWRIVLAYPHFESTVDVIELTPRS